MPENIRKKEAFGNLDKGRKKHRREKIISLTETGKQYARELVLPLFQSEEEAAAQFTEQEMTEVIRMQEKFADTLAKSMEENE